MEFDVRNLDFDFLDGDLDPSLEEDLLVHFVLDEHELDLMFGDI
jgi:hypothetical protein